MTIGEEMKSSIKVTGMQFGYDGRNPLFVHFNLEVSPGSRCLLVGANGSDKVTVDLKVVARMDLLEFVKDECERGATIVYATHIFDGLESWVTDLAYIVDGELKKTEKLSELPELKKSSNLLSVVETWLRAQANAPKKKTIINAPSPVKRTSGFDNSPFRSSRHMAYYR